jgi:iron-sulfur cluster assembly protein
MIYMATIDLSERAQSELNKLDFGPNGFLRINVAPGGCSGMTYTAAIDSHFGPDDVAVFEHGPLRIVTDAGSALFLEGLRVDYSDDLIRSGFRFTNPHAKGSCGCGASFAA